MGTSKSSHKHSSHISRVYKRTKHTRKHLSYGDGSDSSVHCPKRVQFAAMSPINDEVKTMERYIDVFRSELDKPNMWWTRKERQAITDSCHNEIEKFRKKYIDQVRHFLAVFEKCQLSPSQASSNYIEKATLSVPTSIRGLEWGWAPSTVSHRREHVKEILAVQEQIQALSSDLQDRVLSTRSLHSSRPSRVLARLLAEDDERQCMSDEDNY